HTIKPGLTGWAQLCYPYGSSEQDAAEKLQYDLFYVKNHSPLFYLAILIQTVEVIVWGKGARENCALADGGPPQGDSSAMTINFASISFGAAGSAFALLTLLLA